MKIKLELLMPAMPDFFLLKQESKERQEGFNQKKYDIKLFTREEVEEFGELMKQEFIKHWELKTNKK